MTDRRHALDMLDDDIADMIREAVEGCCLDGPWCGALCRYHAGYADGLCDGVELARLHEGEP